MSIPRYGLNWECDETGGSEWAVIPDEDGSNNEGGMMYQNPNGSTIDKIAWALCQILDDDAPLRWTRYRPAVECITSSEELMADLQTIATEKKNIRMRDY